MTSSDRTRGARIDGVVSPWGYRTVEEGTTPQVTPTVTRRSGHDRTRTGTTIVLLGLAMWVVAQALPAYTAPEILGTGSNTVSGWRATVGAWTLGLMGDTQVILIAWTANVWFMLALAAGWRRHEGAALTFGAMATACSAVGMWILLRGGLPDRDPFASITEVGIGSFAWFASTVLVLTGLTIHLLGLRYPSAPR